jgi:hypothetical protein
MKRLIVSEILILSDLEKKARRETFDPVRTIVYGGNDTGKSSLIKSIYHAFGAEPAKVNPRWKGAEIKTLIKFSVGKSKYQLLRDNSYFAIFDGEGTFLQSFTRVSTELAPYLAKLFDFGLILASRLEEPQVPPPAYLFLPFYMDQDASWLNPWSSFDKLWQFAGWKDSLVEYHTGIRNNAYYLTNAELIRKRSELVEAIAGERGISAVLKRLATDTNVAIFSLDPNTFDDRIKRLLRESELLATTENTFRTQLTKLNSEAALQRSRLQIAEKALGEISADFKFLTQLGSDQVECPTCGNEYENDFVSRFAIATDEDRVALFIAQIRADLARTEGEIKGVYQKYSVATEQAERIQSVLMEVQGEVTLKTIIESEGRRAADQLLISQLGTAEEARVSAEKKVSGLEEELKGIDVNATSIRKERVSEYGDILRKNFAALDVNTYSQAVFQTLNPSLVETGSTLPRALLGYQFAILSLISKYSPSTVCPIVVDSPNQQGQDAVHLPQILKFINENQPENTQLILGLENDTGIDFGGKRITTPKEKQSLLQANQYAAVRDEVYNRLKSSLK